MLSRRWPRPQWIKHVAVQKGSSHPSGWNVTLYLQFKRSFFFFFFFSNFPLQSCFEPIRPKRNNKIVNESSESHSAPRPQERRSSHSDKNKEPVVLPIKLASQHFHRRLRPYRPHHTSRRSTNPAACERLTTSSWTIIWWKKARISPDTTIFIYLK